MTADVGFANSGMTGQVGGFKNPGVCLQAFPSFLPQPLPALLLAPFFARVLDSRSSFFAPKPHGNACYAGYPYPGHHYFSYLTPFLSFFPRCEAWTGAFVLAALFKKTDKKHSVCVYSISLKVWKTRQNLPNKVISTYWLSGRAGLENIWLKVRMYGLSAERSVRPDREPRISRPGQPTM